MSMTCFGGLPEEHYFKWNLIFSRKSILKSILWKGIEAGRPMFLADEILLNYKLLRGHGCLHASCKNKDSFLKCKQIQFTNFSLWSIPCRYFPKIFADGGFKKQAEEQGSWFSYDKTARANIFRRDHTKVTDMKSMIKLMRSVRSKHFNEISWQVQIFMYLPAKPGSSVNVICYCLDIFVFFLKAMYCLLFVNVFFLCFLANKTKWKLYYYYIGLLKTFKLGSQRLNCI